MMKVFVTGKNGQLGWDVCKALSEAGIENIGVDIQDFDLTQEADVKTAIEQAAPDCVIHCAAYTAVEKAEQEQELCMAVNATGTRNVALACKQINAKMIYISTDYVFPGTGQGYSEVDSPPAPNNIYGISKLAGEQAVKELLDKYFIVRTSWVFGKNGGNFVKKILSLGNEKPEINVVADQIGSPTYSRDLSILLRDMALSEKYGVYHASNEGICSWYEFAMEIKMLANLPCHIFPVPSTAYPSAVIRPENSRLSKLSLDENGFSRLPAWQDGLRRFLQECLD